MTEKFDMNIIQLTKTGSPVANRGSFNQKIVNNEITGEDSNEFYVNAEQVKDVPQPFKVFKTISRNDFGKWDTNFLVDYIIKTHHGFAKEHVVIIYGLAQKVAYRHSENHPELLTLTEVTFLFLHNLLNQMLNEEQFLFPYIKQIVKKSRYSQTNENIAPEFLKEKIKLFQNEHDNAFKYMKVFRQVTNNYRLPSDACNSYQSLFEKMKALEDDLNVHFHLENDILLPNAIAAGNELKRKAEFKKN